MIMNVIKFKTAGQRLIMSNGGVVGLMVEICEILKVASFFHCFLKNLGLTGTELLIWTVIFNVEKREPVSAC